MSALVLALPNSASYRLKLKNLTDISGASGPPGVAVTPDGKTASVGNENDGSVSTDMTSWVNNPTDIHQPASNVGWVRRATGSMPTGTVTFLFTDIEGSTRLWERYPDAMSQAVARYEEIVRSSVKARDGFVFATAGDGLAVAFARAHDAVAAAVDAQRALLAENWPEPTVLRVRMGAHTGEARERNQDYFGPPVNQAARLMGAANGGQVVVSEVTATALGSRPGLVVVDLGSHRLRGITDPVRAFAVTAEGLEWLERPLTTAPDAVGNLPFPASDFVGRASDLEELVAEMRSHRLVTLTGTGGVGKTRLAVEAGWQAADDFEDGVWLVDLAPVTEPAEVVAAIATTLSVWTQESATAMESVVASLQGRRMLVVMDNCEHVLEPVSDLVARVVAGCPTVRLLATSREQLGVAGERIRRVPSLDAVHGAELFFRRAGNADADFSSSDPDHEVITEICQRLDGIPLAIELAAARVSSLAPAELLSHLDERFRLLHAGGRSGLPRHRTLRATVDWSYQLLSEDERLLFDRASAFAGGFDLRAAEAVCYDDKLDVVDVLGVLVDKSMVLASRDAGVSRYRILETLRQFGKEQLDAHGALVDARTRHLQYYAELARASARDLEGPGDNDAASQFMSEWDNLRAAFLWTVASRDLHRATTLVESTAVWAVRSLHAEHGDWTRRTLALAEELSQAVPSVWGWASDWSLSAGDNELALQQATTAIALAPTPTDPQTARWWVTAVFANGMLGRAAAATSALANAEAALSRSGEDRFTFVTEHAVLHIPIALVDPLREEQHADMVRRAAAELNNPLADAFVAKMSVVRLLHAGKTEAAMAELDVALQAARRAHAIGLEKDLDVMALSALTLDGEDGATPIAFTRTLVRLRNAGDWQTAWAVVEMVAIYWARRGMLEPAAVVLGHLESHERHHPNPRITRDRARARDAIRQLPHANDHVARGNTMTREQILAYVLQQLASPTQML